MAGCAGGTVPVQLSGDVQGGRGFRCRWRHRHPLTCACPGVRWGWPAKWAWRGVSAGTCLPRTGAVFLKMTPPYGRPRKPEKRALQGGLRRDKVWGRGVPGRRAQEAQK